MFNKANVGYHCYLVNNTKCDINIADLFLVLKAHQTMDVLDCNHSRLTVEQVEKSLESGVLSKITKYPKPIPMVSVRLKKPLPQVAQQIDVSKFCIPKTNKPNVKVEVKEFKELELEITADEFAAQNADQAEEEHSAKVNLREQANNDESH